MRLLMKFLSAQGESGGGSRYRDRVQGHQIVYRTDYGWSFVKVQTDRKFFGSVFTITPAEFYCES
jgi:hypothetical protein